MGRSNKLLWYESEQSRFPWFKFFIVPAGVIIFTQILWVLFAHWFGLPFVPVWDYGAVFAIVGGIAGAIFTLGGLIIALSALLSQSTLEDRSKQAVERHLRTLEPELLKKVDARILLLRAEVAMRQRKWQQAEELTREALTQSPDIEDARVTLGLRMSADIIAEYAVKCGVDQDQAEEVRRRQRSVVYADTYIVEAIHWLEDAVAHDETQNGDAWIALAQLYGIHHRPDKMLRAVERSISEKPRVRKQFLTPQALCALISACETEQSLMQRLSDLLEAPLILPEGTITHSIMQEDLEGQHITTWLIARRASEHPPIQGIKHIPGALRLQTDGTGHFVEGHRVEETEDEWDVDEIPVASHVKYLYSELFFIRRIPNAIMPWEKGKMNE